MSYMTRYRLTWNSTEPFVEQVIRRLSRLMNEDEFVVRAILLEHEEAKWYENADHLTILSKEWPGTLFSLDCEGEDGDKWVDFFRNGQHLRKQYLAPVFEEIEFSANATPSQPGEPEPVPATWEQVLAGEDPGPETVMHEHYDSYEGYLDHLMDSPADSGKPTIPEQVPPSWEQVFTGEDPERLLWESPLRHITDTPTHWVYLNHHINELVVYNPETRQFLTKPMQQILADAGLS